MKTKTILQAIEKVLAAVDSKSVVAQTDHLIFSDGIVAAYNGKISISTPFDSDLPEDSDFDFSVPAIDFYKVMKSIDDKDVELSVENDLLYIVSDNVRATLSTEIEEEAALQAIRNFDLEDLYEDKGFPVAKNFTEALELGIYSASKNADEPNNLNCICVHGYALTAGDGYRATCVELESNMERVLIPLSSAIELIKFSPQQYSFHNGWMHLMDEEDTVFSLRIVKGDFPNVMGIIESFEPTIEVELPETLKDVASTLGSIAESPIENFKVIEINLLGDIIECHVEKSGVSATKTIDFEGGDIDASFIISSPMLVSILGLTNSMGLNEKFAMFSDGTFSHAISLVQIDK